MFRAKQRGWLSLLCLLILVVSSGVGAQDSCAIYLDHVEGLVYGQIPAGSTIKFVLRYVNRSDKAWAINNSYFIGSPDGATWRTISGEGRGLDFTFPSADFDLTADIHALQPDGVDNDTIYFRGGKITGPGLVPGFDQEAAAIVVHDISSLSVGKTICLDTCSAPPGGSWKWVAVGGASIRPSSTSPYCFTIGPCCTALRGNVDQDSMDIVDLGDVMRLIDHVFFSNLVTCCEDEADADASGAIDLGDVQTLIDYVFFNGARPMICP